MGKGHKVCLQIAHNIVCGKHTINCLGCHHIQYLFANCKQIVCYFPTIFKRVKGSPVDSFSEKRLSSHAKLNSNKNTKTLIILSLMYLPTALLHNVV